MCHSASVSGMLTEGELGTQQDGTCVKTLFINNVSFRLFTTFCFTVFNLNSQIAKYCCGKRKQILDIIAMHNLG